MVAVVESLHVLENNKMEEVVEREGLLVAASVVARAQIRSMDWNGL